MFAAETYRPYIFGTKALLYSDNQALKWLADVKTPSSRLMRWKLRLAGYDFEINHIKGKANRVADCLSRYLPTTLLPTKTIKAITRAQKSKEGIEQDKHYYKPEDARLQTQQNKSRNLLNVPVPCIIETTDTNIIKKYETEIIIRHFRGPNGLSDLDIETKNMSPGEIMIKLERNKIYIAVKTYENDKISPSLWQGIMVALAELLSKHNITKAVIYERKMSCSTQEYDHFKDELYKAFDGRERHFCISTENIVLLTDTDQINQVRNDFHSSPLSGHQGIHRMTGWIGNRYKWQGMTKDIKSFVTACKTCQLTKSSRTTKTPLHFKGSLST